MSDKKQQCIVVNLFGAPGSGKSTGAAYVFGCLKMMGVKAELVTEFAKDMVWDENFSALKNDAQAYVFGNQLWRMLRCKDKVDVIVTDSPILLSVPYNTSEALGEDFNRAVVNMFNSFDNMSYMLTRTKTYEGAGRIQTENESAEMHQKIITCLDTEHILYNSVSGDLSGYHTIVSDVMQVMRERRKSSGVQNAV